jgi:hypothetical protein
MSQMLRHRPPCPLRRSRQPAPLCLFSTWAFGVGPVGTLIPGDAVSLIASTTAGAIGDPGAGAIGDPGVGVIGDPGVGVAIIGTGGESNKGRGHTSTLASEG